MSPPYKLNPRVATVLAQICCFNNELPQGAPTSPVVANMICAKMDDQLRALARKYRRLYTRYADDMTFSTYQSRFPETLAKYNDSAGTLEPGNELVAVIQANGFKINQSKIRL